MSKAGNGGKQVNEVPAQFVYLVLGLGILANIYTYKKPKYRSLRLIGDGSLVCI